MKTEDQIPKSQYNKFEELSINEKIKSSLKLMNMVEMTPIQAECIPHLLNDNDLLGAAKTGSGKTLAFLIPLVEKIMKRKIKFEKGTLGIILSPTRELSIQTYKVLEQLIAGTKIRGGLIIGGNNRDEETKYLTQGITILVATPGRLLDHLNNTKTFRYDKLRTLVIDEADRLMNQGFLDDMRAIIKKIPKKRQTILFSATLNVNAGKLKKKMKRLDKETETTKLSTEDKVLTLACISLRDSCVCVDMSMSDCGDTSQSGTCTVSQLTQKYVVCDAEDRFRLLCTLLKNNKGKKMMIFMSTCLEVKFYHTLLTIIKPSILPDVPLIALQGKQKQSKREENFDKFKESEQSVLLCTDVAARGLDIPHVDLVIQYDGPEDHKEYIHRVGRTARAGQSGQAIIVLRRHEIEFIALLLVEKVPVTELIVRKEDILPIQVSLEKIMTKYESLESAASEAYKSVVSAYISNTNKCFDIEHLHLSALATNFVLRQAPQVSFKCQTLMTNKMSKKRPAGMSGESDNNNNDYYYHPSNKYARKH